MKVAASSTENVNPHTTTVTVMDTVTEGNGDGGDRSWMAMDGHSNCSCLTKGYGDRGDWSWTVMDDHSNL